MNRCYLIVFFLFSFSQPIFASLIGEGKAYIFSNQVHVARQQAFENAKNDILLQSIRKKLATETIERNWIALRQDILANTNKYLRRIKVLSDQRQGYFYFFQIQAEVLTKNIDSYLQKQNFIELNNHKKVFVIYFPSLNSYSINTPEVRHFFKNLQSNYTKISLTQDIWLNKLWSEEKLLLDQLAIFEATRDLAQVADKNKLFLDSILADLRQQGYHAAVFIDLALLKDNLLHGNKFVFSKKNLALNIKIYDLDIGFVQAKNILLPFFSNNKKNGMSVALTNIITEGSDFFVSFLDDYFGSYYFQWDNKKYYITFNNFNQLEEQSIKDILVNLRGYKNIFSQRSRNKLKISYYSRLSSERIYQLMSVALKEAQIDIQLQSKNSDTISFNKISNVKR